MLDVLQSAPVGSDLVIWPYVAAREVGKSVTSGMTVHPGIRGGETVNHNIVEYQKHQVGHSGLHL